MSAELQEGTPAPERVSGRGIASRRTLAICAVSLLVTLAIYLWLDGLRDGSVTPLPLTSMFLFLFEYYDFYGAICAGLVLVLALFLGNRLPALQLLRWLAARPGTVALVSTLLLCAGTWAVYHQYPLSMDEYAPYFQSRVFAAGHITAQLPPGLVDWFVPTRDQVLFFYVSHGSGQAIETYWPSFALLMTPFTLLGVPWALNPVLSGLTILVMHRLALRIFATQEAAGLAVLLTVASPVFFANGVSFYSMTAHMLANGVFALLLLDPTPRRLVAAGFVGSIALTLHNPVPHFLFALPWLLWLVADKKFLERSLYLALGYLPLCVLIGIGWWLLGNSLIDVGPDLPSPRDAPLSGYFQPPAHVLMLARLVGYSKVWLWAVPGLVVLACVGAWRWRRETPVRLLLASMLLTIGGYFFIWVEQGHGWGFRYFHSAWLALPLLATAAFARRPAQPHDAWSRDRNVAGYTVACALLSLGLATGLRAWQMDDFISSHLAQVPDSPGAPARERVEFYDASRNFYVMDLVQNDPFLRDPVIRVESRGTAANADFMRTFRPRYVRAYANQNCEVWTPAPP